MRWLLSIVEVFLKITKYQYFTKRNIGLIKFHAFAIT